MSDISALAQATTGITALSNLVLVSPEKTVGYQPQATGSTTPQARPLLFQYEEENTVTLTTDITEHYVEDNTALMDHISIKPVQITVRGFIGELTDMPDNPVTQALKAVADKLTVINAYTPVISATAIRLYNEATFASQIAANVLRTKDSLMALADLPSSGFGSAVVGDGGIRNTNKRTQTKQERMFQQLYAYLQDRTLFTVQTPWAIFQNCALKNVRSIQGGETRMISDFELTFVQMRFASTVLLGATENTNVDNQGQAAAQSSPEVNNGVTTPSDSATMPIPGK